MLANITNTVSSEPRRKSTFSKLKRAFTTKRQKSVVVVEPLLPVFSTPSQTPSQWQPSKRRSTHARLDDIFKVSPVDYLDYQRKRDETLGRRRGNSPPNDIRPQPPALSDNVNQLNFDIIEEAKQSFEEDGRTRCIVIRGGAVTIRCGGPEGWAVSSSFL